MYILGGLMESASRGISLPTRGRRMVMLPVHRSPWGWTKSEKIWVVLVVLQASIIVVF